VIPIRAYCASDQAKLISLWERCGLVRPWNVPADDIAAKLAYQPELLFVAPRNRKQAKAIGRGSWGP